MDKATILDQQRANCYKLLSLCYYQPDKEITAIIDALRKEISAFSQQAVKLLDEISVELGEHKDDHYFLVDYAKLFVGPFNVLAAPYSSVYLDHERRIMGDSTVEVCDMYNKAGLVINADLKDIPDHIKVELEFMQYLIQKNIAAEDNLALEMQQDFLLNHLALWLPDFKDAVLKNAQTVLYKNLAEVTYNFVVQDKEVLAGIIKEG